MGLVDCVGEGGGVMGMWWAYMGVAPLDFAASCFPYDVKPPNTALFIARSSTAGPDVCKEALGQALVLAKMEADPTCPVVKSMLLLDSEGKRIAVKYFSPEW